MTDNLKLEATIMAVRENLMKYFKGTNVQSVVTNSNIRREGVVMYMSNQARRYQYQRVSLEGRNPQFLMISNTPFLTLERIPDSVTYHMKIIELSPVLQSVHIAVKDFMGKYLPNIQTNYNLKRNYGKNVRLTFPKSIVPDNVLIVTEPRLPKLGEDTEKQKREERQRELATFLGVPIQMIASLNDVEFNFHYNEMLTRTNYSNATTINWMG